MAVENLKSTTITNLDASPIVHPTAGKGAGGTMKCVGGYSTASASASVTSTYQLVRVPSNAVIKQVLFESEAQTAGAFNLSVYYSDSTTDGTAAANQGSVVSATPGGDAFFASDIDCAAAVVQSDKTNESGNYTLDLRDSELWSALGLSSDPGGFFDIVAVVHTTAVTTGTGKLGVLVTYVC